MLTQSDNVPTAPTTNVDLAVPSLNMQIASLDLDTLSKPAQAVSDLPRNLSNTSLLTKKSPSPHLAPLPRIVSIKAV